MTSRGTYTRQVRVDPDLWTAFDEAIKRVDPETDRSAVLRTVMRWFVIEPRALEIVREGVASSSTAEGAS